MLHEISSSFNRFFVLLAFLRKAGTHAFTIQIIDKRRRVHDLTATNFGAKFEVTITSSFHGLCEGIIDSNIKSDLV